jgi:hypothetical protein
MTKDLDKKINELQQEMVTKAKETLFEHFSVKLSDSVTFIQWYQEPDYYDDESESFRIQYLVASNEEEVKRLVEDNPSMRDWHSDDVELVGWEELLERQVDLEISRQTRYDLNRISSVLALLGSCTIKITKQGITIK